MSATAQQEHQAAARVAAAAASATSVTPRRRSPDAFRTPRGDALVLADLDEVWEAANAAPHLAHDFKLGEVLVFNGALAPDALQAALERQRRGMHRPLGQILLDLQAVSERDLQVALAGTTSMPVVDCRRVTPEVDALRTVAPELAARLQVLPLIHRRGTLVVALDDPWRRAVLDELGFLTNHRVLPVMALPGTIEDAIAQAYQSLERSAPQERREDIRTLAEQLQHELPEVTEDSTEIITESSNALVRLVNKIVEDAIGRQASDIHIESSPVRDAVHVRLRVDGTLVPYLELPTRYRHALVARIKIMADLDIAEHRKPQDGKIDFSRFGPHAIELRVVTVPTTHGLEDVVLRLLSSARPLPLEGIGLNVPNLHSLRGVITKPYGLILICGPTGCGKTTTLHSVLRELNDGQRKIWTAEDPIEISQPGLCQVQVNPRIGWTFAAAMRTFLRADPDVIMIGEMRDEETARIAVEASLTGHLVFSTLHTNSAAESIARLLEIGLDPFNFSDSLLAVLAQRLVRRLCPDCRQAEVARPEEIESLVHAYVHSAHDSRAIDPDALLRDWQQRHGDGQGRLRLWRKAGCPSCNGRGYKGRMGLHELLVADDDTRRHIRHRAAAGEIQTSALHAGMRTLRQDGIEKILQGLTDASEVLAATNS